MANYVPLRQTVLNHSLASFEVSPCTVSETVPDPYPGRYGYNSSINIILGAFLVRAIVLNHGSSPALFNQSINQSIIYLAWSVRLAKASFQVRHEIKIKNGKIKTTLEVYKIKYSDN